MCTRPFAKCFLGMCLACIIVLPTVPSRASANNDTKVLYLADWFGLIWHMDFETQTILGSFPVEPSPTGLALLDGILYVCTVFPNRMLSLDAHTGTQLTASDIAPILDGLATIPDARLIAGIEPSFNSLETLHLYRPSRMGYGLEKAYDPIPVDVPGDAVRGLAYAQGQLYIAEESTRMIYIYDLDLNGATPVLVYDRSLPIRFRAPGLAYDCMNLIAYDIGNQRVVTVSPSTGDTMAFFSVADTGISDMVAGLEVGGVSCGESMPVSIDIKPGSFPNTINLGSPGVVPVAILSSMTFDALTVKPESISLAGARVRLVGKTEKALCHSKDVNADGLPDLLCQVENEQLLLELGDSEAALFAITYDGHQIGGSDSISIVPNK